MSQQQFAVIMQNKQQEVLKQWICLVNAEFVLFNE